MRTVLQACVLAVAILGGGTAAHAANPNALWECLSIATIAGAGNTEGRGQGPCPFDSGYP